MNTDMKKWARVHPLREWGRTKTETLQASLPDFCFFSANPSLLGAIRANPKNPWLDFQKMVLPERVEGFSAFQQLAARDLLLMLPKISAQEALKGQILV